MNRHPVSENNGAPYKVMPDLSDEEYQALKESIRENGIREPIVTHQKRTVLDGHHRLRAIQELGYSKREIKEELSRNYYYGRLSHEEKLLCAVSENARHRRLDHEQRRQLAERLRERGMTETGLTLAIARVIARDTSIPILNEYFAQEWAGWSVRLRARYLLAKLAIRADSATLPPELCERLELSQDSGYEDAVHVLEQELASTDQDEAAPRRCGWRVPLNLPVDDWMKGEPPPEAPPAPYHLEYWNWCSSGLPIHTGIEQGPVVVIRGVDWPGARISISEHGCASYGHPPGLYTLYAVPPIQAKELVNYIRTALPCSPTVLLIMDTPADMWIGRYDVAKQKQKLHIPVSAVEQLQRGLDDPYIILVRHPKRSGQISLASWLPERLRCELPATTMPVACDTISGR